MAAIGPPAIGAPSHPTFWCFGFLLKSTTGKNIGCQLLRTSLLEDLGRLSCGGEPQARGQDEEELAPNSDRQDEDASSTSASGHFGRAFQSHPLKSGGERPASSWSKQSLKAILLFA